MKQIIYLLMSFSVTAYCYCQDEPEVLYPIIYKGTPTPGTISITSTGVGKNMALSIKDGISKSFYALLFRGIPGSQYDLPIVPDENERKNDRIIKELLDGGYSSFIVESKVTSEGKKKKKADGLKGMMTENFVTINCDALRRYLEQNKVIRKFGI